jgi:hypothetical protein
MQLPRHSTRKPSDRYAHPNASVTWYPKQQPHVCQTASLYAPKVILIEFLVRLKEIDLILEKILLL